MSIEAMNIPETGYLLPLRDEEKKEWVGLDIHEIRELRFKSGKRNSVIEFAKAIEAKLKEKNHGG
jgi:hypothetical protein